LQVSRGNALTKTCKRVFLLSIEKIKKQKIFPLKTKNKTLQTNNPTDKNPMIKLIVNKRDMSLDEKEGQLLTKAKIKRAVSANLRGYTSNKIYRSLTVLCFEMPASF